MPRVTPAYIKVDANGHATGVFPGGVELPVPAVSAYEQGSAITWTEGPNGVRYASLSDWRNGTSGHLELESLIGADKANRAELWLSARGGGAVSGSQIRMNTGYNASPTDSSIVLAAGGKTYTLGLAGADFVSVGGHAALPAGANWEIWGFYNAAYAFPAGGAQTIDVAVDAGILAGQFIPVFANNNGFASDRINFPTYVAFNPSTLRITVSTDWAGGAPSGTLWFYIMTKA